MEVSPTEAPVDNTTDGSAKMAMSEAMFEAAYRTDHSRVEEDARYLWQDCVRIGLQALVAVDEVIEAADRVLVAYKNNFFPEPAVPESFYKHDPDAKTKA